MASANAASGSINGEIEAAPVVTFSADASQPQRSLVPAVKKGEFMGRVIHLRKQSPEPAYASQFSKRSDEVLADLGAIADGIVMLENKSATMVQCISALQASIEALEGIHGAVADPGDHERFLRRTKLINSGLRSELTKLASILLATRVAADEVRQLDPSVR